MADVLPAVPQSVIDEATEAAARAIYEEGNPEYYTMWTETGTEADANRNIYREMAQHGLAAVLPVLSDWWASEQAERERLLQKVLLYVEEGTQKVINERDAAVAELAAARAELERRDCLERPYNCGFDDGRRRAEAERDEARAALDRVEAALEPAVEAYWHNFQCPGGVSMDPRLCSAACHRHARNIADRIKVRAALGSTGTTPEGKNDE